MSDSDSLPAWHIFRCLKIDVTDDMDAIGAAYAAVRKKYHRMIERPKTPDEKVAGETFEKQYSRLKQPKKRNELIATCFEAAKPAIASALEFSRGQPLTAKMHEELVQIPVKHPGFAAKLAAEWLDRYLAEREPPIKIGTVIPKIDVPQAGLVERLRFSLRDDGVFLTWSRPANCDSIILVRKQRMAPASLTDGEEICKGNMSEYLDVSAVAGTDYYYGVFSVWKERPSESCAAIRGFRANEKVSEVETEFTGDAVKLTWKTPPGCQQVQVYRSSRSHEQFHVEGKRLIADDACRNVGSSRSKFFKDDTAKPGERYYYHLVADYGAGWFSTPATQSFEVPQPLELRRADISLNCVSKSVQLSWPNLGEGCLYRVFRFEAGATPKFDKQIPLYDGLQPEFQDRDLSLRSGFAYDYYVGAQRGAVQVGPILAGTAVICEEVLEFLVQPGDQQLKLSWTRPPGMKRVRIRRAPFHPGRKVDWDSAMSISPEAEGKHMDRRELEDGVDYVYRITGLYRSPVGEEVESAGKVSEPQRHFRIPPAPKKFTGRFADDHVVIEWRPVPDMRFAVFKLPTAAVNDGKRVLPWSVAASQTLKIENDWRVHDRFEPKRPWYILASRLGEDRLFVHQQLFVACQPLKAVHTFGAFNVTWEWPEGVRQAQLTRRVFKPVDASTPSATEVHDVTRGDGETEGHLSEETMDVKARYRVEFQLDFLPPPDGRLQVLGTPQLIASRIVDPIPVELSYRVEKRKKRTGWLRGDDIPVLVVEFSKSLRGFGGINIVTWPEGMPSDEGDVLHEWRGDPAGTLSRGAVDFPLEASGDEYRQRVRVELADESDVTQIMVIHPPEEESLY